MPAKILNLQYDPQMVGFMDLCRRINASIKKIHGAAFNMDAPKRTDLTFKINDKNSKYDGREVRLNDTVPNEELFTLAQELVKAADEPFSARSVFATDNSFHVGSQTIGFDVLAKNGEAKIVATGRTTPTVPRSGIAIGRNLQHVGKIMTSIEVTRDDLQQMDLRGDRGFAPLISLMEEKLQAAREDIFKAEDSIVWMGGNLEGQSGGEIQGVFNRLSTTSGDYSGNTPTHGKRVNNTNYWVDRAAIIAQLVDGFKYITRNNAYMPNTVAVPPTMLFGDLSFTQTTDTDSTPLIEWIRRAAKEAFKQELDFIAANAMAARDVSGTERGNTELNNDGMLMLDSQKKYQAIAVVEDITLLPSKEDEQGTIVQVVQMKTGGLQTKHPSAMYLKDGIQAKAA
jgi:hypothetical protein